MKKLVYLTLLLVGVLHAQSPINGEVLDGDGFGVSDIVVTNTTTNETATTDSEGAFTINAKNGDELLLDDPEYDKQTIVYNGQSLVSFALTSKFQVTLDEVVQIGYSKQRKELTSGAFSSVSSEDIMENSPTRIDQALQGKASGVQVVANSGAPGAGYNIRIRGVTSNGDNSPLVVVDGVQIGNDLSIIDPNDIETIDIVKDASTAIYGVQGANGVILITTKSGKFKRKLTFDYNGSYAIQEASNLLDLMNGQEYAGYMNEAFAADGDPIPFPDIRSIGVGTNWQAQVFNPAGMSSHSISAAGGNDFLAYGLSGSYLGQDGVVGDKDKANYKRYTLRNNLNIKLTDKISVNTLLVYINNTRKSVPDNGRGSVLYYANNASPLTPVFDGTDGSGPSNGFSYISTNQGNEIVNPLAVINNSNNITTANRLTGKAEVNYEPIKGLNLTSRYNFNVSQVDTRVFTPLQYYGANKVVNTVRLNPDNTLELDRDGDNINDVFPTVFESTEDFFDYTWESFATYDKNIGDHSFNTLVGFSIRSEQFDGVFQNGYIVDPAFQNFDHAFLGNSVSTIPDSDYQSELEIFRETQANNEDRWYSVFGRIQYDYKDKYLLTALLRRDASTRFGPENRIGYFPSFSAGWVVDKESFFNVAFINQLKLRASWGITGNDKIGSYRWIGLLQGFENGNIPEATYPFGDAISFGNALGALSNPSLQWETTTQTNIGLDAKFWKRKFEISMDYFVKTTDDLLLVPDVSALLGIAAGGSGAPVVNAGSVENKGFEFSITFNHDFSKDFGMNFNYNFTTLNNEVLSVNNDAGFITGGLFGLNQATSRMQTGLPLGVFYGLQADGIFQNQAEIDAHATQAGAQPGDIRYRDVNGDGVIEFGSEDDLTVIGNPIPDIVMGASLGFNYKNFDISTLLYASIGNEIVRSYERFFPYNNKLDHYLNRWTGEGTSNEVPRASFGASNNILYSSFFVEDGSYLRIQNLQIGYSFSPKMIEEWGLKKFRLYFTVNNVYTFTKYLGYDPDVSVSSPIGAGVDYGQYPQTRQFITGVNISF